MQSQVVNPDEIEIFILIKKARIHRKQHIFQEGHNCDSFDVSSVFAMGCKKCLPSREHGLVNSLSTVGLLFPWVICTKLAKITPFNTDIYNPGS